MQKVLILFTRQPIVTDYFVGKGWVNLVNLVTALQGFRHRSWTHYFRSLELGVN